MISVAGAVHFVILLIVAAIIFCLLFWLLNYCESQFPAGGAFFRVGRVILVILAVLVLIGLLLNFAGYPVLRP